MTHIRRFPPASSLQSSHLNAATPKIAACPMSTLPGSGKARDLQGTLGDVNAYRRTSHRMVLSVNGAVPAEHLKKLTPAEKDVALGRLDGIWTTFSRVQPFSADKPHSSPVESTLCEANVAMKRWFYSHHLFIPQLSELAHCLDRAVDEYSESDTSRTRKWIGLACKIRKGCGALFIYGTDFEPCSSIYCNTIRNGMPPGFSGFWIRERNNCLQPAVVRFQAALSSWECVSSGCKDFRSMWAAADTRYHELHVQSMQTTVQDGKSLAKAYREENGRAHCISEQEFSQLDEWFCIDRREHLTRLDYISQICDLLERIAGDLFSGHRLHSSVLSELVDSVKAVLVIFGDWIGVVPETSRFYPRTWRGE